MHHNFPCKKKIRKGTRFKAQEKLNIINPKDPKVNGPLTVKMPRLVLCRMPDVPAPAANSAREIEWT